LLKNVGSAWGVQALVVDEPEVCRQRENR